MLLQSFKSLVLVFLYCKVYNNSYASFLFIFQYGTNEHVECLKLPEHENPRLLTMHPDKLHDMLKLQL